MIFEALEMIKRVNNRMVKQNTETCSQSQCTWRDEFRDFIEACAETDCSDYIKYRQKARAAKSLKRQRKRRNRTIAFCTVAGACNKAFRGLLK